MRNDFDPKLALRHRGTLGGRLKELTAVVPTHVVLVVSARSAASRTGQLLATHAANLLGRLEGVVGSITCVIEGQSRPLLPDVDPRVRAGDDLEAAIERSATLASKARWSTDHALDAPVVHVAIGQPSVTCDLFAAASGWTAYIGTQPGPDCTSDGGSVGAYTAAAFVAAEVFRAARMTGPSAVHPAALYFDAWQWRFTDSLGPVDAGPGNLTGLLLPRTTVAGVGAVGCAALLTLWTTGCDIDAILVDGDIVSLTNLNRYALFSLADIGLLKVDCALALLRRGQPSAASGHGSRQLVRFPGWWSEYMRQQRGASDDIILSAVDTNTARHQLQDALPRLILGGSTLNLRAEVGRYDLSRDESRCLKCFNPPEEAESDALVHRRLLGLDAAGLERAADERGVSLEELQRYVAELRRGGNGCGILTGDSLDKLRRTQNEEVFAVSFVSSLAGTLLATQLIREALGQPLLVPPMTRAQFQLERPGSEDANACFVAPRDPTCDCAGSMLRMAHRELWDQQAGVTCE